MLSDSSKFKTLNVKPGKEINFLLQQEDRLTNFLKKVKKSISEKLYKELYPRGSQPGIMYGLSKIHKPLINNFPNCALSCQLLIQLPVVGLSFLFP